MSLFEAARLVMELAGWALAACVLGYIIGNVYDTLKENKAKRIKRELKKASRAI